jgi:hypothetical protein
MNERMPIDYESIIQLGAKLNRPTETLMALQPGNDPFNAGRPARRRLAEWFAELWERFGFGPGTHLRRVHYRLVSQANQILWPDGEPYENTDDCWTKMGRASRDARYLGLVPIEDFVDRRNDDVIEHLMVTEFGASLSVTDPERLSRLRFSVDLHTWLPNPPDFQFSRPIVDQRYHVELWAEKTTMNDVLVSLARRYDLNVVTASGEISVTHCYALVQRAKQIGRPVRILYISDFDPAGRSIPVACARKIEFFVHRDHLDLDVQVRPIALSHEQCVQYRLPRTPLKKTERRAAKFEARYGEGATELDALEALRPGELRRILEREVLRYHDTGLDARVAEAESFRAELAATRQEILDRHADERRKIKGDYDDLVRRANPALKKITDRYSKPLRKIADRFNDLQHTLAAELKKEAPNPDAVDWPEPADGDEDADPLFDSGREYVEQIDRFKRHQDKPTVRKARNGTAGGNGSAP